MSHLKAPLPGPDAAILVPVDMSAPSERALLWAARLADRVGAPLVVLHVVHDPVSSPGFYRGDPDENAARTLDERAGELLDDFMRGARADHPDLRSLADADVRLVTGLPAQRIVEYADRKDPALIVIGSHGRTGIRRLLIGSVALKVAQLSTIPVTVVRWPSTEAPGH